MVKEDILLSCDEWQDPVFELKYACYPYVKDPGKPAFCVKDPSCWLRDCLVSITTLPTHCDVT